MPKKTFHTAPRPKQPTADEIRAFEQGGPGQDAATDRPSLKPVGQVEPTKRLSLDIPESLHRRFKTACSATGRVMVAEIQQFIERRSQELEIEAGIAPR